MMELKFRIYLGNEYKNNYFFINSINFFSNVSNMQILARTNCFWDNLTLPFNQTTKNRVIIFTSKQDRFCVQSVINGSPVGIQQDPFRS